MPRQKRVDVAGVTYHAINRGNARLTIFHKPEDYDAFIRLMAEGTRISWKWQPKREPARQPKRELWQSEREPLNGKKGTTEKRGRG